jgi:GNAT superfamily N-acetyltransferase
VIEITTNPELTPAVREAITVIWGATTAAHDRAGQDDGAVRATADRVLTSVAESGQHVVVACVDGTVVGCAFLVPNGSPAQAHWMQLKAMMVHPQRQSGGIGGAVLGAVHDFARGPLGLAFLSLTVQDGTGAKRFYERHGWTVAGRLARAVRTADGDRDLWQLERRFDGVPAR